MFGSAHWAASGKKQYASTLSSYSTWCCFEIKKALLVPTEIFLIREKKLLLTLVASVVSLRRERLGFTRRDGIVNGPASCSFFDTRRGMADVQASEPLINSMPGRCPMLRRAMR